MNTKLTTHIWLVSGTPPFLRRASSIRWRLAGTFLIEDVLGTEAIRQIVRLQPHYVGNFQNAGQAPLINEEKVLLAVTANSTGELHLPALRSMVKKGDTELIASLVSCANFASVLAILARGYSLFSSDSPSTTTTRR